MLLATFLIIISCEKDDDIPLGTISVFIDGDNKRFNTAAMAESLEVEGGYGILIHGFKGPAGSSNEISVTVVSLEKTPALTTLYRHSLTISFN